jgi:hypothetical protein
MKLASLALLLLPATALAVPPRHFDLTASFLPPAESGANGAIAVRFQPLDPDLRLNESPAPRLKLALTEEILVDRQGPAPRSVPDYDPLTAKYLDPGEPVLFPVALAPSAPRGEHWVKASVVYFYCSLREAWCRRGTAEVELPVRVP